MFALKENIVPHFAVIVSVDHGTDVNPKVQACYSLAQKMMLDNEPTFDVTEEEAKILRGAEINLGLDSDDLHLCVCLNLHSVSFSRYGRDTVIDYMADLTKNHFFYAMRETGKM